MGELTEENADNGNATPDNNDNMQMEPIKASSPETDEKRVTDPESTEEKLPYPKSVFFIVSNEFCERFSYYGMKAILTLYFTNSFGWEDKQATVIYHVFSSLCYFTPLLGAMIADSLLGKFRTIFYLSIVYCLGNIVLSLSATPPLNIPQVPFSMLGLGLIALGTGGIKPCVAAFGGDQFILPQQSAQLASFFFIFYFSINSGSLISTIVTPIMRDDVRCFDDECFTLAFSVPAALMITALMIFLLGKPLYRVSKPTGNVVLKLLKCIWCAIGEKRQNKKNRDHWLDHADTKFEKRFIEDVKIVLRVLLLYIPLPFFWALFDQQGSRWTLQATRMDGSVGSSFTIKPDQVQVLNPALILIFIPIFDRILYPLLSKCRLLRSPLQRLTVGGVLAGVAFIASGVVELELEKTYPLRLGSSEASMNLVNTLNCPVNFKFISDNPTFETEVGTGENQIHKRIWAGDYTVEMDFAGCTDYVNPTKTAIGNFMAKEMEGYTVMAVSNGTHVKLITPDLPDDREKPKKGTPVIRFLTYGPMFDANSTWTYELHSKKDVKKFESVKQVTEFGYESEPLDTKDVQNYDLILALHDGPETKHIDLGKSNMKLGGGYVYTITQKNPEKNDWADVNVNGEDFKVVRSTITDPNSLHLFWLLPQYVIITMGEVMFSITGLEFSYSQSPISMKSVMQSAWLLTVAFGNLIVVIVAEAEFFQEQSKEFFLFAALMFADMIIFAIMAFRYVPAQLEDPVEAKKELALEEKGNENKAFDDEKN